MTLLPFIPFSIQGHSASSTQQSFKCLLTDYINGAAFYSMQAPQACASQVGKTQYQNTLYYNIRVLAGSHFCPLLNHSSAYCLFTAFSLFQ